MYMSEKFDIINMEKFMPYGLQAEGQNGGFMMKKMRRRWMSALLCAAMLLQLVPGFTVHVHAAEGEEQFSRPVEDGTWGLQAGRIYLPVLEVPGLEESSFYTISCRSGDLVAEMVTQNEDGSITAPENALELYWDSAADTIRMTDGRTILLQKDIEYPSVEQTAPEG